MFARMLSLLASLFSLHDNGVSLCPNALYPVSKADRVVGISQSRETPLQGNEAMEGGSQTNCCLHLVFLWAKAKAKWLTQGLCVPWLPR